MKTVLVFKAPDILMRDAIQNKLLENEISYYGSDSSINVVYPNTPNLYWAGVSATFEGYRILVPEEHEVQARALIDELLQQLETKQATSHESHGLMDRVPLDENNQLKTDYARRFYLLSLSSLFIPILPFLGALYYFTQAIRNKTPLSFIKTALSFLLLLISVGEFFFLIRAFTFE